MSIYDVAAARHRRVYGISGERQADVDIAAGRVRIGADLMCGGVIQGSRNDLRSVFLEAQINFQGLSLRDH